MTTVRDFCPLYLSLHSRKKESSSLSFHGVSKLNLLLSGMGALQLVVFTLTLEYELLCAHHGTCDWHEDILLDSTSIQTLCDPLLSAFNQPTLPFFALDSPAANLPQKEGGHGHRIWRIFTAHFPLRSDLPHHQSFKLKNFLNEMLNLSLFCPNLSYNSLDVYNSGGGVVPNSDAHKYGDP